MAGLLDTLFGNADQTRALGLLGAGMMNGGFAKGAPLAMEYMAGADDRKLKRGLLEAQIANYQSEAEARKIAADQARRKLGIIDSVFGAGGVGAPQVSPGAFQPSPSAAGPMGPVMPQSMGAMAAPGSRLANLNFDELARLKVAGLDFTDLHKYANDPLKMEAGATYRSRLDGSERHMPRLPEGMAPGANGQYEFVPGYEDSMVRLERRKAGATEGARADYDPVQVQSSDGSTRYVPRSQVVRPTANAPADADRFAILTQELQRAEQTGNARDAAAIRAEIARLTPAARTAPSPSGLAVAPGYQATPSTAQVLSKEAGGKINDSWLKTSYEPTLAAGNNSRDLLETVQVTRQAMQNLGGTGWSTQAKAAGAAILTGLGIAPKNAEMFAANAELFQKTAMERLWTTLNEAKGPQTEGDADRASKTYAALRNTTKANEFILDFAEAKAQRDQVKAKFYQQALPVAKDRGDLSEVDREWSKRAPSIFTMPSLKRWGGGIK